MTTVFVYGTLKKGHYNNTRFGPVFGTFVKETSVKDMAMVMTNPHYPTAVRAPGLLLKGEEWRVTDDDILQRVRRMELGAGYEELYVTLEDGTEALMWADTQSDYSKLPKLDFFPLKA